MMTVPLIGKYPGFKCFRVVGANEVASATQQGWVVLDTLPDQEALQYLEETKTAVFRPSYNCNPGQVPSLPQRDMHRGDNIEGVVKTVVLSHTLFLLGMDDAGRIKELVDELSATRRRSDEHNAALANAERNALDAAKASDQRIGELERQVEGLQRDALHHQAQEADRAAIAAENRTLRSRLDKLRAHIGQREYRQIVQENEEDKRA